jgi:hypothetical protein
MGVVAPKVVPTGNADVPTGVRTPIGVPGKNVVPIGVSVPMGESVEKIEPESTGERTPIGESVEKIEPTGVMVPTPVLVEVSLMPPINPISAAAALSCEARAARCCK